MNTTQTITWLKRALALGVVLGAATLPSCSSMLAWTVASFAPPQKVKPVFVPPKDKKVLVFVDDMRTPVSYEPIKRDLTEKINKLLMEKKLVREVVPYEAVMTIIGSSSSFNDLAVTDVGRKVGAELVLYVEITQFRLKENEGSPLWEGRLATSIRWVAVEGKTPDTARLWPKDRPGTGGYDVPPIGMPVKEDMSLSYGSELARNLADRMADRIVKLFYEYEAPANPEDTMQ